MNILLCHVVSISADSSMMFNLLYHLFVAVSQCQQYKEMASVPENKPAGTFVLQVHAVDADEGANGKVTYGFMHKDSMVPAFNIDPHTGTCKIRLE